ncbi:DNA-processing protein DprA [Phenylobacterium immobile]|uniref:DNA-processing protein DprA n=1 Tax=Phenylobacterium immobile TaxID=21 RepID=UPI000A870F8A|nr:DNA-processing protein DprA [Phenylobacterium immobile]
MSPNERRAWLKLARTETVGPVAFAHLIDRFGDAEAALAALPDLARNAGRSVIPPSDAAIDRELAAGETLGARLLCSGELTFPPLLAAVDPPPPVLWARGNAELLVRPTVAIVGARVASASAQGFARGMAAELGAAGLVIVSGLARGIDKSAHEGALRTGTVAVLGGGVDDIYPAENTALYGQIVESGCVVSENEPGRKAVARDFPRRNRIISGLSRAVVVVEAEIRSGSLITARLAAEQGREVLAVPGSPLDPRARGANDLIRQGAALCEGADDVLRALEGLSGLREPEHPYRGAPSDPDEALRERIYALLSPTPAPIDEIVRACAAPASLVFAALVELSIAGRCELAPGGMASRI